MKIKEMKSILNDKSKENLNCNFKLTGGHSKFDIIIDRLDKIDERLDKIDQRIDNLVTKNNLSE